MLESDGPPVSWSQFTWISGVTVGGTPLSWSRGRWMLLPVIRLAGKSPA